MFINCFIFLLFIFGISLITHYIYLMLIQQQQLILTTMATITIQTRNRKDAREMLNKVYNSTFEAKWANRKTSVVAEHLVAKIIDDYTVEISSDLYTANSLTYCYCNSSIY